jgi:hypothetical protein
MLSGHRETFPDLSEMLSGGSEIFPDPSEMLSSGREIFPEGSEMPSSGLEMPADGSGEFRGLFREPARLDGRVGVEQELKEDRKGGRVVHGQPPVVRFQGPGPEGPERDHQHEDGQEALTEVG